MPEREPEDAGERLRRATESLRAALDRAEAWQREHGRRAARRRAPTPEADPRRALGRSPMIVYCVVDSKLSPTFQLGTSLETFLRREDAERFVEDVRGDDEELASELRIVERELEAGGRN